jgi:hypothetical protein
VYLTLSKTSDAPASVQFIVSIACREVSLQKGGLTGFLVANHLVAQCFVMTFRPELYI